jgi:hypothetical protein
VNEVVVMVAAAIVAVVVVTNAIIVVVRADRSAAAIEMTARGTVVRRNGMPAVVPEALKVAAIGAVLRQ